MISYLDIAVVGLLLLGLATGLVVVPRRHRFGLGGGRARAAPTGTRSDPWPPSSPPS